MNQYASAAKTVLTALAASLPDGKREVTAEDAIKELQTEIVRLQRVVLGIRNTQTTHAVRLADLEEKAGP